MCGYRGAILFGHPHRDLHHHYPRRRRITGKTPIQKKSFRYYRRTPDPLYGPIRALDVGTGFGRNAVFLAHHLAKGSHVWSVDPSGESLERGEAAVKAAGLMPLVTLVPGVAEHLPFADNVFHVTMAAMIFHHLVSLPPALREMARVTRLGGKLLLVDWAPTAHLLPFAIEHRADDFFTARAVVSMLNGLGLEVVSDQHPEWYVVEAVKK